MIKASPDLFTYVSFPVIDTEAEFVREFYDTEFGASKESCLYAVIDKVNNTNNAATAGSTYAGVICLSATNLAKASTEIGVMTFPAYQRTHVSTNAIGLLLQWTLDPPALGGLGLRRVEWRTNSGNTASRRTALRMGFEFEGIMRWERVFPRSGGLGLPVDALEKRNGTTGELPGRHTAVYSIVWDEWDGKRERVVALMQRR